MAAIRLISHAQSRWRQNRTRADFIGSREAASPVRVERTGARAGEPLFCVLKDGVVLRWNDYTMVWCGSGLQVSVSLDRCGPTRRSDDASRTGSQPRAGHCGANVPVG